MYGTEINTKKTKHIINTKAQKEKICAQTGQKWNHKEM